jgi:hypothetical protein
MGDYGAPITRAEFTALLVNAYEYEKGAYSAERSPAFGDISRHAYAAQIRKGFSLGVISGVSEAAFQPDAPLTREQAAKIICATAGAIEGAAPGVAPDSGYSPQYADQADISGWALPFVAYAAERGLMSGADDGKFYPLGNLSREEAMALAERMIVKCGGEL